MTEKDKACTAASGARTGLWGRRRFLSSAALCALAGVSPRLAWATPIAAPPLATAVCPEVELPPALTQGRFPGGFCTGNFSVAAQVSADGLSIPISLINPPVLGQWLTGFARSALTISAAQALNFQTLKSYAVFPETFAQLFSPETGVEALVQTFAPIGANCSRDASFNTFLPAIIVQVTFINHGETAQRLDLDYATTPVNGLMTSTHQTFTHRRHDVFEVHQGEEALPQQHWLFATSAQAGLCQRTAPDAAGSLRLALTLELAPQKTHEVAFVFGVHDGRGYTSERLHTRRALETYLLEEGVHALRGRGEGRSFKQQHDDFIASFPRTGDAEIDVYARWYASAGILLTKGLRTGEVLTMGYSELNQRDSFWTSGVHLVYWPDLELKMLRESMAAQGPNGQVPLCILPLIHRENNIDGNEYFILRIARYYRWRRDAQFLASALPHVKRAIDFLVTLDRENIGLPMQVSYWADWKDVPGVEGRKYAPCFVLLWLAALKEALFLAQEASDADFSAHLSQLFERASERANRDVAQGGLWGGERYVEIWADGREANYTRQDQAIVAMFDVVPPERLERLYANLNRNNETTYGVRETYPYIANFEQSQGAAEYHNGGIWPYLNFGDCLGRYRHGRAIDAERIIKKVGFNDLVRADDYAPGEFLHGETGESRGFAIQGWDAALFSTMLFGALGLERSAADQLTIHVNVPPGRDFQTMVRLPEGDLLLRRMGGAVSIQRRFEAPLQIHVAA